MKHSIRRRPLVTLCTGMVGAGLFLSPAAAFADTGQVVAQTTDRAGDARAGLRNEPTADLLAAGARIASSTVTVFFDLGAAPTQAQLADASARGLPYGGRYDYTSTLTVDGGYGLADSFHDTDALLGSNFGGGDADAELVPTPTCVAHFGDAGPTLRGPVVVDAATGELSATFSRADVNAVQACYGSTPLAAGHRVAVSGANADIQTAYQNPLVGGAVVKDSAGAGPAVTLVS